VVLDGVSLEVREDEVTCLVGVNGSGKTTIVEIIEGLRRPDAGTIDIDARRYAFGEKRPARLGVQLQEESLPARIRWARRSSSSTGSTPHRPLRRDWIRVLGLDAIWQKKFVHLSGGQKRRVVVGLAIVGDPRIVILDEPTSGLDPGGQESVLRLIEELRRAGVAVLLTTHDLAQAAEIGDRVVLLHRGRLLASGRPQDLVAGLAAATCISIPAELALAASLLDVLEVQRTIVYAERRYLYGDEGMIERLTEAGGLQWLTGRIEVRPVTLLDVFLSVVAETGETTAEEGSTAATLEEAMTR
jgi:ABC-2 type transport system ATP-binding protein